MAWLASVVKWIPLIVTSVTAVERLSTKKGKEKQDEAIALIGDLVPLVEASVGRDLLDEGEMQRAIRTVIDAIVHMQNVARDLRRRT